MDYAEQNRRSAGAHQAGFNNGLTCIDCHKGIAHALPAIEQHIGAPKIDAAEPPKAGAADVPKPESAPPAAQEGKPKK